MPPVFVIRFPQRRKREHRHTPGQNAPVENVVFAALRLNLFRRSICVGESAAGLNKGIEIAVYHHLPG
jgi:hypothetical protein